VREIGNKEGHLARHPAVHVFKRLDSFSAKTRLVSRLVGPAGHTSGRFGSRLFAMPSPCVVESRNLVQFDT
jgi:hypothetical protein